jgi:hypothetical protein
MNFRKQSSGRALVVADLIIALGIIVVLIAPLSISWLNEQRVLRGLYQRAVAMQILDGEAEIMAAGTWATVLPGVQDLTLRAEARSSLPPGRFISHRFEDRIRLEWIPEARGQGGGVTRTLLLPATEAPRP